MSSLSCGIVGLPNVGKSTLFNALTKAQAEAANYPFCTIEPNIGIVLVPDPRLEVLAKISKTNKIIYATMKFVDIAGLVAGASQGEGLGNQFLANIRETDAILHVVRCFDNDDVVHVSGSVDPIRDIEVINLELVLADLQMIENIIRKVEKQAKSQKEMQPLLEALQKVEKGLNDGIPVRRMKLTEKELELLSPYAFLSQKKVLYAANVSEKDLPEMNNAYVQKVKEYAAQEGQRVVTICGQIEEQLAQFEGAEQQELLESVGLKEPGLHRLIREAFDLLGLATYLTTGEIETRAWTIRKGMTAPEAAGVIHTDLQKKFVRAEVVKYEDFVACEGRAQARATGKLRAEGKEYLVQDGDVILFL